MTRISNDVQEIEISVMASLTMIFRDPMYIMIFVIYLFVSSYELTLFALALLPVERLADWQGKSYLKIIFTSWSAAPGKTSLDRGRNLNRFTDHQRV